MTEITPFPLLVDNPKPEDERGICSVSVDCTGENLVLLCAQYNVNLIAIFEVIWALALARYSGTDSVGFYCIEKGLEECVVVRDRVEIDENRAVAHLISNLSSHRVSSDQRHKSRKIDDILPREGEVLMTNSIVIVRDELHPESHGELLRNHKVRTTIVKSMETVVTYS
jgi:hypothetical protein